jgi:hypothetical protein
MLKTVQRLPLFKLIAVAQIALLARRHVSALTPIERRRLGELVRHGRRLSPDERRELRQLAMKLEPRAFAGAMADHLSPFPLPKRVTRGPKKKRRAASGR